MTRRRCFVEEKTKEKRSSVHTEGNANHLEVKSARGQNTRVVRRAKAGPIFDGVPWKPEPFRFVVGAFAPFLRHRSDALRSSSRSHHRVAATAPPSFGDDAPRRRRRRRRRESHGRDDAHGVVETKEARSSLSSSSSSSSSSVSGGTARLCCLQSGSKTPFSLSFVFRVAKCF